MQIAFGNGGWVEVTDVVGVSGLVYLRLQPDDDGLWTVREMYVHTDRITVNALTRIPVAFVELQVNAGHQDRLASRLTSPSPDLRRLAGWFSGRFSVDQDHWVAQSMWAQVEGSGVPQAPDAKRRPRGGSARPPLNAPQQLDEPFFRELVAAYVDVVSRNKRPAVELSAEAGVSPRTVHRWIFEARKRGYLPRGTQGRAGL